MAYLFSFINLYLIRYLLVFYFASIAITPAHSQVKLMVLGNSITQGNATYPGYRYELWKMMVDDNLDVELVGSHDVNHDEAVPAVKGSTYKGRTYTNRNEGHWGWSTDEVLNGKDGKGKLAEWLQTYTPDMVLMHLGTNDMFRQCSAGASDPNKACFQETINELKLVVQQIRAKNPNATIFIAKLIPAYIQKVGPEAVFNINELNKRIPALVTELNKPESPVILVDQNSGFDATTGVDTHDGVHPNTSGELKMAQKWFDAMQPLVTPFPVELLSFSAMLNHAGQPVLKWKTASEKNNAFFEIERATDEQAFLKIAQVKGAGTTPTEQTYTFADLSAPAGVLHYRLRQVDVDGTSSISKIVVVQVPEREVKLRVYPTRSNNRTNLNLTLHHHETGHRAELVVYNMAGKRVYQQRSLFSQNGTIQTLIPTHHLKKAGLYLVRVVVGQEVFHSKFMLE
ncbi:GDSL-type esterase/lipase family protein [Pontibacter sp. CAU 1760]